MMDRERLFDAYLEGTLTPEQEQRLTALLEDDKVGREFVEYVYETTQMLDVAGKLGQQRQAPRPVQYKPSGANFTWILGAAAAIILVGVMVAAAYVLQRGQGKTVAVTPPNPATLNNRPLKPRVLKIVVVSVDGAVLPGGRKLRKHEKLAVRSLALREGKATIRLENGVRLKLRADSKIEFYSKELVHFRSGDLTVRVPNEAVGFTVKTEDGDIVDLGTEFELRSTADGSRVNVTEGSIRVHSAADPKTSGAARVNDVIEMSKKEGLMRVYPKPGKIDPATGEFSARGFAELVPWGAVWCYNDGEKLPDPAWNQLDYDDSGWAKGKAKIGFGDPDVVTVIPSGSRPGNDRLITAWFRHDFNVPADLRAKDLRLLMKVDDGAVIYVNGKEVGRYNMPEGEITPLTRTLGTVNERRQPVPPIKVPAAALRTGKNVLAVEVHQRGPKTSDLWLDICIFALIDKD